MIDIFPAKNLADFGTSIPGSKSYTNRALLLASLAEGKSTLINPLLSDDTKVMITALKQLGVTIKQESSRIKIVGNTGIYKKTNKPLYLGNAGTAVRSLSAIMALQDFQSTITGNERMQQRPIKDLTDALTKLGAKIDTNNGCPPINILAPIKDGKTTIKGDISSQYLSALLMAAPLAIEPIVIEIEGELTSLPYVQMTIDIMDKFGVSVEHDNYSSFRVKPQKYSAIEYQVEADASSATYPLALAAIHGSKVTIENLSAASNQADIQFLDVLEKMGCEVEREEISVTVKGPEKLIPLGTIDLNGLPDAAMTVAILCAFAEGRSELTGLANLRVKETDRLEALANEMQKIGVSIEEKESSLIIDGDPTNLHGAKIETYDDHRMAMCFAVAASKIANVRIRNPGCVSKTYPIFWKDLKKWGVKSHPVEKKKNIVLCGLRGSGKSTIGKLLAKRFGFDFVDTDNLIEQKNRSRIQDIVKEKGWNYFREQEEIVAKELSQVVNTVISTGGGMFTNPENIEQLKKNGYIALLSGPSELLASRIEKDPSRPPLTDQPNMIDEMKQLWQERKHNYFKAADGTFTVSDSNDPELVLAISQHVNLILDT